MAENGHYNGEFERLVGIVEEIDQRTSQHTDLMGSMAVALREISSNTGVVAKHYAEDNRELSKLAAGKNQVSIFVLLVLMVICGAYVLAEKVSQGQIDINIPFIGLEIVHGGNK